MVIVLLLSFAIGWLLYSVFNDSIRYLYVAISSLSRTVFGMLPLCGNNLTVLEICSAIVFVAYTR